MKTHLVIGDPHAHPDYSNARADWLGKLILDLKPEVVINMGDTADLASMSSFDKGKASFHGRNYQKDIEAHLDFQDRMWHPIKKAKRKLPHRVVLEGNHENRIKKAIQYSPELEGDRFGVSFKNLAFDDYYDGIDYCHYAVSGVSGRALSSIHHGYDLTVKRHTSTTVGHSHLFDYHVNRDSSGRVRMGLVAGVYQDYRSPWAGDINSFWTAGVAICRNVENGVYDFQWLSIDTMKREYS
jgi:hypothetical protein